MPAASPPMMGGGPVPSQRSHSQPSAKMRFTSTKPSMQSISQVTLAAATHSAIMFGPGSVHGIAQPPQW